MEKVVHRIVPIDGELVDLMKKTFTKNFIKLDGYMLPENYKECADAIEDFEVRDDDVWVCSFPKTGTTWTQEMVWCIVNDLDFERGKVPIHERFPCIEFARSIVNVERSDHQPEKSQDVTIERVDFIAEYPSPRFIKTHLPLNLLPRELRNREKKPKIIYIVRNPKDTCISFYHYCKLLAEFEGTLEDFCTLFLGDRVRYAPFWDHVLGFWNNRNVYEILFLKYEDMKKDLPSVVKRTATFLGKDLNDDQISLLTEHLSFASMKVNPAVNYEEFTCAYHKFLKVERKGTFMRSGTTEQWKTAMNPEFVKRFDDWTDQHLQGTGLSI